MSDLPTPKFLLPSWFVNYLFSVFWGFFASLFIHFIAFTLHGNFSYFTGVPKETADKILKYTGFFELKEDGDLFIVVTGYEEDPSLDKTYRFKMNETFTDTDNFGQKFTVS